MPTKKVRRRKHRKTTLTVDGLRWDSQPTESLPGRLVLPSELGYAGSDRVAQIIVRSDDVLVDVIRNGVEISTICAGPARARRTAEILYASLSLKVTE